MYILKQKHNLATNVGYVRVYGMTVAVNGIHEVTGSIPVGSTIQSMT